MNADELKKEAEEWIAEYTGIDVETQRAIKLQYHDNLRNAYLASAEPREKRIAELQAQIEKMKCGDNCKYGYIACGSYLCDLGLDGCDNIPFNCDKWEIKEK